MKTNICTDTNQSARLLACGVDPKTADMSVLTIIKEPDSADMAWHIPKLLTLPYDEARTIYGEDEITPAWSLSMLCSLLPDRIKEDNDPCDEISECRLLIYPCMQCWYVDYIYCKDDECDSLICIYDTSLIEACVQMIEYLTANGYSLNKTEE